MKNSEENLQADIGLRVYIMEISMLLGQNWTDINTKHFFLYTECFWND